MENLKKIYDELSELNDRLFEESEQFIIRSLNKIPSKSVEFDHEINVCVTYDGGRHPEYDANPYSRVERVYLENGKIYLETEDCTRYDVCNIYASELYDVAEGVDFIVENDYDCE